MATLKLLLSLHDVTPHHLARLTQAEALFGRLGVSCATYMLVPRFHGRWAIEGNAGFSAWCRAPRPFAVRWCLHGYFHQELGRSSRFSVGDWGKRLALTGGEGEFLSLGDGDVRERIDRGADAFRACLGIDPTGFVAPAWLFNRALIPALRARGFSWTEDHHRIYDLRRDEAIAAPVVTWATRTLVHRRGSKWVAAALLRRWSVRPLIRIAVHPRDFDDPCLVEAIQRGIAAALRDRVADHYEGVVAPE
jgi:predicted deacetylase